MGAGMDGWTLYGNGVTVTVAGVETISEPSHLLLLLTAAAQSHPNQHQANPKFLTEMPLVISCVEDRDRVAAILLTLSSSAPHHCDGRLR